MTCVPRGVDRPGLIDLSGSECGIPCSPLAWLQASVSKQPAGGGSLWEGNECVNNSGKSLLAQELLAPVANEIRVKHDESSIHTVFIPIHRFFIPPHPPGTTALQFFKAKKSSIHSLDRGTQGGAARGISARRSPVRRGPGGGAPAGAGPWASGPRPRPPCGAAPACAAR